MTNNDLLQSALNLANQGFHVFPVNRVDKKPLIKGWTNRTATSDASTIEQWWKGKFKDANVAVSCGMSDVVVLDVDLRHNGHETIAEWEARYGAEFARTVTAISGSGGPHHYFKADGKKYGNSQGRIGAGIDIRASGGLVVAPFSLHANGNAYTWKKGFSPDDREILPLPDWLAEKIGLRHDTKNISPHVKKNTSLSLPYKGKEMQVVKDHSLLASSPVHYLQERVREHVEKKELKALDADLFFIRAVCLFLKIPATTFPSDAFLCVLPGHEEKHPSASIHQDKSGAAIYHDWHHREGCPEFLTLTDVFAAQTTGHIQALKGPWLATWKLRMLVEMGLIELFPVSMPPLPLSASDNLRAVYEGFRLLLGCKWLYEPNAPTPFTYRFGGDWCGVSQKVAQEGIQRLYAMGIVECVGTHKGIAGNNTALYLPCATQ